MKIPKSPHNMTADEIRDALRTEDRWRLSCITPSVCGGGPQHHDHEDFSIVRVFDTAARLGHRALELRFIQPVPGKCAVMPVPIALYFAAMQSPHGADRDAAIERLVRHSEGVFDRTGIEAAFRRACAELRSYTEQ